MRSELSKRKKTPRNLFLKKFPPPTNHQVILSPHIIKKSEVREKEWIAGWVGPKKHVEGRSHVDIQGRRKSKRLKVRLLAENPELEVNRSEGAQYRKAGGYRY